MDRPGTADALARYRAANETIAHYEAGILPESEGGLNLVREGYRRGQFDILRPLQAQRAFSEARLNGRSPAAQAYRCGEELTPWA